MTGKVVEMVDSFTCHAATTQLCSSTPGTRQVFLIVLHMSDHNQVCVIIDAHGGQHASITINSLYVIVGPAVMDKLRCRVTQCRDRVS